MVLSVEEITWYVEGIRFHKRMKQFPNQRSFWEIQQGIPGEIVDSPGELDKSIKTESLSGTVRVHGPEK